MLLCMVMTEFDEPVTSCNLIEGVVEGPYPVFEPLLSAIMRLIIHLCLLTLIFFNFSDYRLSNITVYNLYETAYVSMKPALCKTDLITVRSITSDVIVTKVGFLKMLRIIA